MKLLPGTDGDIHKPWFANQPAGQHTLANMVKLCCEGDDLRAMCHKMFATGVPEKVVQERTSHRSIDGLRQYERTSVEQHVVASQIVASKFQNGLHLNSEFRISYYILLYIHIVIYSETSAMGLILF